MIQVLTCIFSCILTASAQKSMIFDFTNTMIIAWIHGFPERFFSKSKRLFLCLDNLACVQFVLLSSLRLGNIFLRSRIISKRVLKRTPTRGEPGWRMSTYTLIWKSNHQRRCPPWSISKLYGLSQAFRLPKMSYKVLDASWGQQRADLDHVWEKH